MGVKILEDGTRMLYTEDPTMRMLLKEPEEETTPSPTDPGNGDSSEPIPTKNPRSSGPTKIAK